jgi:transposase
MRPGTYNDEGLIGFLQQLRLHFRGDHVVLLWDGLPSHRSGKMTDYLKTQRHWLKVERLPGYAPELNPAEGLFSNLKGGELANRAEETIDATVSAADEGVSRVRRQQALMFGFLAQSGLRL